MADRDLDDRTVMHLIENGAPGSSTVMMFYGIPLRAEFTLRPRDRIELSHAENIVQLHPTVKIDRSEVSK